jgi:hypothetical protein
MSKRKISASLSIGVTAAGDCIRRARRAGLSWPPPEEPSDAALERLLYPPPQVTAPERRPQPMTKLMYVTIATGLLIGVAMFACNIEPATASLPGTDKAATVNIRALHSSLNVQALPNGDVDEGNSD